LGSIFNIVNNLIATSAHEYLIIHNVIFNRSQIIRDYYKVMIFPISALVSALDSHINPDSEAGGLIWADMENFNGIISSNIYVVLNRKFHSNVNVLGRFCKHILTSLYRLTLLDIFLKPDSKQKY
jgi:hypothetical protein